MSTINMDVSEKSVGRVASQIALLLQNKNKSSFRAYKVEGQKVVVTNTDKLVFTGRKFAQKIYYHHTGVIGHLRKKTAGELFKSDSREVLKRAVRGMLPKNRLLKERMKNLILYKGSEK
ncbi:MAG: 50S ribosomal protein L13 [bacterium]|nr:50S ribosomal protein L13 [bacterium]